MLASTINNQTNFTGAFKIAQNINTKTKANFYKVMDDIYLDAKPYDIIVKKHPENKNFLTITAQNTKKPSENYSIWIHSFMERIPSLRDALIGTMRGYEEKFDIFI